MRIRKICYVVTIPTTIRSFFMSQLQYLAKHGFDVSVICARDEKLLEDMGNGIHYIPTDIPRGISFGGSIKAVKELINIFKREKFDLIQYSTPNAALYASIAAKIVGCKIRNYHLMGFRYLGAHGIGKSILKTIEKVSCWNSTSIECVSRYNLELGIKEKVFPAEKATVVWNGSTGGVNLERFDYFKRDVWRNKLREELGYEDADFIYGFVGRITRDKGINELLEAFFELKDDSKLFLIGNVEDENTLDKKLWMKAKNHPNVQIHTAVSDIERYFAMIDVLVLPSYREGFGNVVIEAAAVGTPAIVSNIPGPIDTIDAGKTALTVEVKNADDLKEKMMDMKSSVCTNMGTNAVEYVKYKFDSKKLCEKILERKKTLLKISKEVLHE